jgi:polyferredoxin
MGRTDEGSRARRQRSGLTLARRLTQAAFLVLFAVLAFETAFPPLKSPSASILLRLDPLAAIYAVFSTHSLAVIGAFWPAWVLLGLTLLSGRFFCGWICPLGTCFDAAGRVKPKALRYYEPSAKDVRSARGSGAGERPVRARWLRPKYILLVLVLGLAFAKVDMLFFGSPMAVMSRTAYYVLLPGVPALFIALILLAFFYRPRFWCESICPAGALLSAVSALGKRLPSAASPLSVVKDTSACTSCGSCYKACGFGVAEPFYSGNDGRLRSADCTECGACVGACPEGGALELQGFGGTLYSSGEGSRSTPVRAPRPVETSSDGTGRRFAVSRGEFIGSMGVGALLLAGYGTGLRRTSQPVLRMPGAQDETAFLSRCNRCLACARACPAGCLKPAGLDSGLQKLWTPTFQPRTAGCIFDQCSQACETVCPAGAIERVKPAEVRIGLARIDHHTCLGWLGKQCLVCMERCRFNAVKVDGLRPSVLHEKCTGCGACEETCPTTPESIKVYPLPARARGGTAVGAGRKGKAPGGRSGLS